MAQRVQVLLVDDLDGGEATQTVTFGLDGSHYEIDLSDKNAETLRTAFGPFIPSARKVGGKAKASGSHRPSASRSGRADTDANDVRAWAKANGYAVNERGRISAEVREAYAAAQAAPAPAATSKGKGKGAAAAATETPA